MKKLILLLLISNWAMAQFGIFGKDPIINKENFDKQRVHFGCTCSEDRVRQSLSIYSAQDIATMTTDEGRVTADCQFCGAHYDLDPLSVGFEATKDA